MKNILVALLLSIGMMPFVSIAAELVIPKSFEFLAVDGKDLDPGALAWNRTKSVELSPGLHRVAFKFYEVVPDEDNPRTDEFLNSEPILLTIQVSANKSYQLVPHPDMQKDMRAYAANPRLKIVDQSGLKADYELTVLGQNQEPTLSQKLTQPGAKKAVAAAPVEPVNDVTRATLPQPTASAAAPVNGAAPAAAMLQYWWSQADAQTRSEFMRWVYSQ